MPWWSTRDDLAKVLPAGARQGVVQIDGADQRALQVDRLESAGPVVECHTRGLRGLLPRAKHIASSADRMKLDPPLPRSVAPLRAVDMGLVVDAVPPQVLGER